MTKGVDGHNLVMFLVLEIFDEKLFSFSSDFVLHLRRPLPSSGKLAWGIFLHTNKQSCREKVNDYVDVKNAFYVDKFFEHI